MNKILLMPLIIGASFALGAMQSVLAEGKHDHNHGEAHWAAPKDAAARTNPINTNPESIERGAKSYNMLCVSCHGVKAMGDGVAGKTLDPKPTNLKAMSGMHTDGDFSWKIANGRGAMPAWEKILDENQIWDLVNFIQNLKNEGFQNEHTHNNYKDHTH